MARVALRCKCGWSFFITASTQGHEVTCSSCGGPVPIPGRRPGEEVLTPGEMAARKIQQARTTKLLAGAVAGVILIGLLLAFWLWPPEDTPRNQITYKPRPTALDPTPPPRPPTAPPRPTGGGSAPTPRTVDVPFLTQEIDKRACLLNMRGIVTEVLRLKGQLAARDRVLGDMAADEAQIAVLTKKITDAGASLEGQGQLKRGDTILSYNGGKIEGEPVRKGREILEKWLGTFTTPTDPIEVVVSRGVKRISLYIRFPFQNEELLSLARLPVSLPEDPAAMPKDPTPKPIASPVFLLNKAVLDDAKARIGALAPGYLDLLSPEDRTRLVRLLNEGKGSGEDNGFLEGFQATALRKFEADSATIVTRLGEIRLKAMENSDQVDVVWFKNGRKKIGKVVKRDDTQVWLKLTYGKGTVTAPFLLVKIQKIDLGGGNANTFPSEFEKAKGRVASLDRLLTWCEKERLEVQKVMVAVSILEKDPTHPRARKVSGIPAPSGAVGVARGGQMPPPARPIVPPGAKIPFDGKDWDPKALRDHLTRVKKYELIEGRWYRRKEKTYTYAGLLKDRRRNSPAVSVVAHSASLISDYEGVRVRIPSRRGLYTLDPSPVPKVTAEQFFAPSFFPRMRILAQAAAAGGAPPTAATPGEELSGEVHIKVVLEGPLLEASVKMRADVRSGGVITVFVQPNGGVRTRVYDILGEEFRSRELPRDLVRGLRQLDLVASLKMHAGYETKRKVRQIVNDVVFEEIPVYTAKLFPSSTRTSEVLVLTAVYGMPMNSLDKLFEQFPQVLRQVK